MNNILRMLRRVVPKLNKFTPYITLTYLSLIREDSILQLSVLLLDKHYIQKGSII
jgi:hypothetical protein